MTNDAIPPDSAKPNLVEGQTKAARRSGWIFLKRAIALTVSASLAVLVLTAALPPIVADQSDRAVVDAPVTLLTAPIEGEVTSLNARPGAAVAPQSNIAEIVNSRVDRTTLITLEGKQNDTSENLQAIRARRSSEEQYVRTMGEQIARQTAITEARYQEQIVELKAQVGAAGAAAEEKKQIMGHQTDMVSRGVASPELVRTVAQQLAGAQFQEQGAAAKLAEKQAQLDSARKGIFVGDDVHDLAAMIQKKRDMELDIQRLAIEETQVASELQNQIRLRDAEQKRLASLQESSVQTPGPGEVIHVGASAGRHVAAGDTLARMVNCNAAFVVAIFSYRQGGVMTPGTRVTIDAGPSGPSEGTVTEILPKTSDKVDESYALPFPQTERRELYVLVKPDHPLRRVSADGARLCDIGRWVTVTSAEGWVPSTSVLWRSVDAQISRAAESTATAVPTLWAAIQRSFVEHADASPPARTAARGAR